MPNSLRSTSSGNDSDTKYSYLTGSALYTNATEDIDSQYDGSIHVYEYDESTAGHNDEEGPIDDIDIYPVLMNSRLLHIGRCFILSSCVDVQFTENLRTVRSNSSAW